MISIGFTGSRLGLTDAQREELISVLKDNQNYGSAFGPSSFHHGDCIGADAEAHRIALSYGYRITIHPPESRKLRAFTDRDDQHWQCYPPLPYHQRNIMIVAQSNWLFACPSSDPTDSPWWTIRFARKTGHNVLIIHPDGKVDTC